MILKLCKHPVQLAASFRSPIMGSNELKPWLGVGPTTFYYTGQYSNQLRHASQGPYQYFNMFIFFYQYIFMVSYFIKFVIIHQASFCVFHISLVTLWLLPYFMAKITLLKFKCLGLFCTFPAPSLEWNFFFPKDSWFLLVEINIEKSNSRISVRNKYLLFKPYHSVMATQIDEYTTFESIFILLTVSYCP